MNKHELIEYYITLLIKSFSEHLKNRFVNNGKFCIIIINKHAYICNYAPITQRLFKFKKDSTHHAFLNKFYSRHMSIRLYQQLELESIEELERKIFELI